MFLKQVNYFFRTLSVLIDFEWTFKSNSKHRNELIVYTFIFKFKWKFREYWTTFFSDFKVKLYSFNMQISFLHAVQFKVTLRWNLIPANVQVAKHYNDQSAHERSLNFQMRICISSSSWISPTCIRLTSGFTYQLEKIIQRSFWLHESYFRRRILHFLSFWCKSS